jgi:hypothetical protein
MMISKSNTCKYRFVVAAAGVVGVGCDSVHYLQGGQFCLQIVEFFLGNNNLVFSRLV